MCECEQYLGTRGGGYGKGIREGVEGVCVGVRSRERRVSEGVKGCDRR